ncbi:chorismate mutase [Candidatus Saccharibacteria bacterium]|nr:chorismate mutase [Candidatus Saccharibacteria bacterium]
MHELEYFRKSIDNLGNPVMYLIAERFRLTQKIGKYKKANNMPPVDSGREA